MTTDRYAMSLDAETPRIPASPEYFNDHEPQWRMSTRPVCRQTWLKADLMGPVREDGLNVHSYGQRAHSSLVRLTMSSRRDAVCMGISSVDPPTTLGTA